MEIVCKDCGGTGKLGFQREDCWFCGGNGYINDLVYKSIEVENAMIRQCRDATNVKYNGNLDEYFQEVKECDITNDIIMILSDMYDLIKK